MEKTPNPERIGPSLADLLSLRLQDAEFAAVYITEAINDYQEDGDWADLKMALHDVAKAKGISQTARLMGIQRQALSNLLNGNSEPRATRFLELLKALNLRLQTVPATNP